MCGGLGGTQGWRMMGSAQQSADVVLMTKRSVYLHIELREAIKSASPKGLPACRITSSSPFQSLLQILPDSLVFSFRKSSSRGPATSAFRAGRRLPRTPFHSLWRLKLAHLGSSWRSWPSSCPSCSPSWRQDAPTSPENGA